MTSILPTPAFRDPAAVHDQLLDLSRRAAEAADFLDQLSELFTGREALTPHPACAPLGEAAAAAHDLCVSAHTAAGSIRPSESDGR
ncbi:MAG TPA: hypothetical protein VJ870_10410 [Amycolatopsis sp.]|nr:hypothetical protein [Amycolatopsis sp.]